MLVSAWRRNVQSWLTRTSRPRARSEQPSESTAPPGTALRLAAFERAMPWLACSMVDTTPPEKNGNTFVPPSFKWIVAGFNLPAAISLGIIGSDFELAPCTAMIIPTNSAAPRTPRVHAYRNLLPGFSDGTQVPAVPALLRTGRPSDRQRTRRGPSCP